MKKDSSLISRLQKRLDSDAEAAGHRDDLPSHALSALAVLRNGHDLRPRDQDALLRYLDKPSEAQTIADLKAENERLRFLEQSRPKGPAFVRAISDEATVADLKQFRTQRGLQSE